MEDQNFIEDRLLIITKQTFETLTKYDNAIDLIALYLFYYSTAKWQRTNQVKATTGFVIKGLNLSEKRIQAAKKVLIDLNLIEDVRRKDPVSGFVVGYYIKIKYLWTENEIHPVEIDGLDKKSTPSFFHPVEERRANALDLDIKLNALDNILKPEFLDLATLLKNEIQKNDPGARITEAQVKKWANEVRLMVERDKRTIAEVREVLLWSQNNQFWKQNILSMGTLRDKFTRLKIQSKPGNRTSTINRERGLSYVVSKKPSNV